MVEENEIAKTKTGDYVVHDTIEDTHETYNTNMVKCIQNVGAEGMAFFGSHNEDTVILFMNLISEMGYDQETKNRFVFGQLYGLGDHLSYYLEREGYRIIKVVPYGEPNIMFPYLMRRAQESKILMKGNNTVYQLLKAELGNRLSLRS